MRFFGRRFDFDSIASRIGLTLVLALAATQLVSFALVWALRPLYPPIHSSQWLSEHLGRAASAVFAAPPNERESVLERLADDQLSLRWRETAPEGEVDDSRAARMLQFVLEAELGAAVRKVVALHAGFGPRGGASAVRPASTQPNSAEWPGAQQAALLDMPVPAWFEVAIEGADGSWLVAASHDLSPQQVRHLTFGLWLVVSGVTVALLSGWTARRLLVPVRRLADAARHLGLDPHAPFLPETGPKELRAIVAAFNAMVGRLRRFIADRTQMMAAMSHDLRTPLTRLRLHAEFVSDPEQRRKMLADIAAMDEMIESTLSFAADEARQEPRRRIDIASLVATICDDMTDLGHKVLYRGPSHLVLSCQPGQIRRALTNLVDNAIKYASTAEISLLESPELIEILIRDDGPGIPEAEQEAVFQPFYRLERSRNRNTGGIGLGLAVARAVVRAHGGDILLANLRPTGLEVKVTLPRGSKVRGATARSALAAES